MAERLTTLVYGTAATVDEAKAAVESDLGAVFTPRSSDYRGGAYWLGSTDREGETIIVQTNAEMEGPLEPAELQTIIYIEGTARASELTARFAGGSLVLIRQNEWRDRR